MAGFVATVMKRVCVAPTGAALRLLYSCLLYYLTLSYTTLTSMIPVITLSVRWSAWLCGMKPEELGRQQEPARELRSDLIRLTPRPPLYLCSITAGPTE